MNENKHTPEPWRTDAQNGFSQDVHDADGNFVAACSEANFGDSNARRIVACVNRLAQFTTEQIEDFGYDLFAEDRPRLVEAQNEIHLLKKQRDELLAALIKYGLHKLSCDYVENHEGGIFGKSTGKCDCGFAEVIASVKGEQ